MRLRRFVSAEMTPGDVVAIREILRDAFGTDDEDRFTDDDWAHALGGTHVVLEGEGVIVGHAAVVERALDVGGVPVRTGYVEAVAVAPAHQRHGLGSMLMLDVGDIVDRGFDLGALGTGRRAFYERLGWRTWRGPSSVRTQDGERLTPDDDGFIMVRPTPTSPPLDLDAPISCDWRPGDVW